MAEVILVQPKIGTLDELKSAPGLPLSLLSSVKLVARDFKVKLIDQRIEKDWKKSLKKELKKNPLCVGTTAMLGPQIRYALEISQFVKENSDVPVVWGGPHAGTLPIETISDKNIDIIVKGDGEVTFWELIKALKAKKSLKKVKGLFFKKNGEIIQTESRELVDLNKMPDVPYHLVDVKNYLPKRMGVNSLNMETSRGCLFRCTFCYNPCFNQGRWRALKPKIVLERVEKIVSDFKVKGIWFIDDEFFIDLLRAKEIIQGLKKLGITWDVQGATIASALRMDYNYLGMLEEAGCTQLNFGVESGSERILKRINKAISVSDVLRVNRKFAKFNIIPWYYFVIGFPYETEEDRRKTIALALRLLKENPKAKISPIACFTPYPGTQLFEESKKYGFKPPEKLIDWASYATEYINVPWLSGPLKRKIQSIQFASYFIDQKARDVVASPLIKFLADLYRPIAKFRLKNNFYLFPLEAIIGFWLKDRIIYD